MLQNSWDRSGELTKINFGNEIMFSLIVSWTTLLFELGILSQLSRDDFKYFHNINWYYLIASLFKLILSSFWNTCYITIFDTICHLNFILYIAVNV